MSKSSPRAWRCFQNLFEKPRRLKVLSTCVEVFPGIACVFGPYVGPLHVRGGVSLDAHNWSFATKSSPRAWRCFYLKISAFFLSFVLSTCVEVFPDALRLSPSTIGPLHVRGGVSSIVILSSRSLGSSPRAWRCFRSLRARESTPAVLSTCVEVFPDRHVRRSAFRSPLHMRGGVQTQAKRPKTTSESSPHAWRC